MYISVFPLNLLTSNLFRVIIQWVIDINQGLLPSRLDKSVYGW